MAAQHFTAQAGSLLLPLSPALPSGRACEEGNLKLSLQRASLCITLSIKWDVTVMKCGLQIRPAALRGREVGAPRGRVLGVSHLGLRATGNTYQRQLWSQVPRTARCTWKQVRRRNSHGASSDSQGQWNSICNGDSTLEKFLLNFKL